MNRNYWVAILLALVFIGYFHEYLFMGQDAHVRVHDNLDSDVTYRHHLAQEHAIFAGPKESIRPIMNGLPRVCLPSGLNIMVWLYGIFGTFGGFVLSEFLVHVLAYLGVYVLLKNHFLKEEKHFWIRHAAALFFACMPFFPVSGGAVALQPLLLNSFLNIRDSGKLGLKDLIPVIIYPFYSSFVWVGLFVLIFLGGFSLYNIIRQGLKKSMAFIIAMGILSVLCVIADYQLFMVFFDPGGFFVNHRTEIQREYAYNYKGVVLMGGLNSITGIYHSTLFAGLIFYIAPVIALVNKLIRKESLFKDKTLLIIAAIFIFFGLMTTFWFWDKLGFLYTKGSLFNQVNFSRFHYLLPLSGLILTVYSIKIVQNNTLKYLITALLIIGTGWHYKLYYDLHHYIPGQFSKEHYLTKISYKDYFSEDIFSEIRNETDKIAGTGDYNVIGMGVQPAVLQHNGFNTLDSYQNFYPLEYKHRFMKIMEKELDKCPELKEAFMYKINNKCYLYSCEVHSQSEKEQKDQLKEINELLLNPDEIRTMNGQFIISKYKIVNFGTDRIKEVRHYTHSESQAYKDVYLYQVL